LKKFLGGLRTSSPEEVNPLLGIPRSVECSDEDVEIRNRL